MVVNNPNNWHWVDKNCIEWTRQYFKDKIVGLSGESNDKALTVVVDKVTSVEGDVVVSQRKGKIISLFDVKLVLGYEGKVNNKDAKGSLTVPEVAYDTEEDEYQFDISVFSENSDNTKIREVVRQKLVPQLRKILTQFGKDLMITHGSDIQVSADKVTSQFTKANQVESLKKSAEPKKTTVTSTTNATKSLSTSSTQNTTTSSAVPKYNTSTLHFEPVFNATAEQLFITLLEKNRVGAWTRSNPDFAGDMMKEGTEFQLFGGGVSGKVIKLIPNQKIEQQWRLRDWKDGYFATLTIDFHQGDSETKLDVLFKGIPVGEEDVVQGNFEDYYVRSIKITFGFGAVL
jgi:activator of HSP90 ATPase